MFKKLYLILFVITNCTIQAQSNKIEYSEFQYIFEKIQKEYVEEPAKQELLNGAISGMLSSLDPYSSYIYGDDFEDFMSSTKGEFSGIGVEIIKDDNLVKVISPIDDLPAAKAGILPGDLIIAIDDELVSNLGFSKAAKNLRGLEGTKVKVTIFRESEKTPRDITLIRKIVKIQSVKAERDNDIAYVRISTFNENTFHEFLKSMKTIINNQQNPIKGIIMDLRNNPGGLVVPGTSIAEYFLKKELIVKTKGRTLHSEQTTYSNAFAPKAPEVPMVILVNSGSASTSEIVAGALQDNKRAIVLGTKTFGKALVQSIFPLPFDTKALMKLTTAKYYTPSGKCIQGVGIIPDIVVELASKVEKNLDDKDKATSAVLSKFKVKTKFDLKDNTPEKQIKMSEKYKNDNQYSRAYDILQGLTLLSK